MTLKIVTFGEILLRLSPPGAERLLQSPQLSATFGGSEANVAVSLAHFGYATHHVSRVPAQAVGDAAVRALRAEGVDTRFIVRGGSRLGLYFAELGVGPRPMQVIYDRAGSAFAQLDPARFDWSTICAQSVWFHSSGITPALSTHAHTALQQALAAARTAGARISFDLNYRHQLWTPSAAQAVLRPLVGGVDLLLANREGLRLALGIELPASWDEVGAALPTVACDLGLGSLLLTWREQSSASEHSWGAWLCSLQDSTLLRVAPRPLPLVDRIVTGDSLAAGLIHGLLAGRPLAQALALGVAASWLKPTIPGDFNRVSLAEVETLAAEVRVEPVAFLAGNR